MSAGAVAETQTGIPIEMCELCGRTHPITRTHCAECGAPSLFEHAAHSREVVDP